MIKQLSIITLFLLFFTTCAMAADKKSLNSVSSDVFTAETQKVISGGKNGIRLAWWVPAEFWTIALSGQKQMQPDAISKIEKILQPYFMVVIAQADISPLGAFDFYSKEIVLKNTNFEFMSADGKKQTLTPLVDIDENVLLLQQQIAPMLQGAMGNLGNNIHFLTFSDVDSSSQRVISPYEQGTFLITTRSKDGGNLAEMSIETPIDSLFEPRICPNGKPAHISWKYCPWSGKELNN